MRPQPYVPRLLIGIAALCAAAPAAALAETFTVPLSPSVAHALDGDYLSASYDFGTAFSHVDSVTLDFSLPNGFNGSGFTTGNSSYYSALVFVLHDAAVPITDVGDPKNGISVSTLYNPATDWGIIFGGLIQIGDEPVEFPWPDFVLQGKGKVGFVNESRSIYHPLPDGIPLSSTTSWTPPFGISGATLTIIGTPVPEPGAVLVVAISSAAFWLGVRRKSQRSRPAL